MTTDRQLLTKEITIEFIRRTVSGQKVNTQEVNRLVDNTIGEDEDELYTMDNSFRFKRVKQE